MQHCTVAKTYSYGGGGGDGKSFFSEFEKRVGEREKRGGICLPSMQKI